MLNNNTSSSLKKYYPALTGIRIVLAWMIFLYHFIPFNSPKYPHFLKRIIGEFHFSLDCFYVLSGFLIALRYYEPPSGRNSLRNYFVGRFSRVYPMVFIIITLYYIYFFLTQNWQAEPHLGLEILTNYTLTKTFFSEFILTSVPQTWSLTLEEVFYFLAPIFFVLLHKSKTFMIVLPVTMFLIGAALNYHFEPKDNVYGFFHENKFTYFADFFAGIFLYFILKSDKYLNHTKYLKTFTGIVMMFLYVYFRSSVRQYVDINYDFPRFLDLTFVSFFCIVPFFWGLATEDNFVTRLMSTKFFTFMGQSSFSFYLIHKGFIAILLHQFVSTNFAVIFLIMNILGALLFYFVEEPLNLGIRKRFYKK